MSSIHTKHPERFSSMSILTPRPSQKPKHQHEPPGLKAGAVTRLLHNLHMWLMCSLRDAGGAATTRTCGSYTIGVRNEQLPRLRDSTSSLATNGGLCSGHSHPLYRCFQWESRTKTVTQHNCWYVLSGMMHCCSCKQLLPFCAVFTLLLEDLGTSHVLPLHRQHAQK